MSLKGNYAEFKSQEKSHNRQSIREEEENWLAGEVSEVARKEYRLDDINYFPSFRISLKKTRCCRKNFNR